MEILIKKLINTKKCLVIAPSSYHVPLMLKIQEEKGLFDIKYISKEQFISSNSFELKEIALVRLSKELRLSPTVLAEMIEYLPYLNDEVRKELPQFVRLEGKIKELDLINKMIPFESLYHGRAIFIYGYPVLDKLFLSYMKKLDSMFSFEIVEFKRNDTSSPFLAFHSEYEEVDYLCNMISQELLNGTQYKHIKVHVSSPSYHPVIRTLFARYNLTPYFSSPTSLASLNVTSEVLEMIKKSKGSIEDTLSELYLVLQKKLAYTSEASNKIFIQYISVLNKYIVLEGSLSTYLDLIEYDLSVSSIKNKKITSSIFIGDLSNEYVEEKDTIIVLGCNEGEIPSITKNNGILDNSILSKMNAETSTEKSNQSKALFTSLLCSHPIKYVSYASHSLTSEKIISTLAVELLKQGTFIESSPKTFMNHFSVSHDVITLAKMISEAKEYGIIPNELPKYANSVLSQRSYPKPFIQKSGVIEKDVMNELLEDLHSLSYSSINDYFKCQFRFLLKKIMKVPENYGEQLPALIGDLFHKTLQRIKEVPLEKDLKEAFFLEVLQDLIDEKELDLSNKEHFYLTHSFTQLSLVVDWIKDIHRKTKYSPLYNEKEYIIPLNGSFIREFKGVVDVIMTLDRDFFIMDYKTGYASINISNLEFGMESQLVFYLYLVSEGEKENLSPSGFFYSPVFSKLMNAKNNNTYEELLAEHFKLDGFVSEERLSKIDPDYENASFIKGIKTKKNSTVLRKGAKTISSKNQEKLTAHIKSLLEEAVLDIENGIFDVNPKGTILESESCSYCEFKDICFKRENNFIQKSTTDKHSLAFLNGGEDDDSN